MVKVRAQKIPRRQLEVDDLLAKFCYTFPQYTFVEAKKVPYKRVIQMLTVARREEARKMYELMQLIAAPNTKRGSGIKKVLEYYKGIMEGKNG